MTINKTISDVQQSFRVLHVSDTHLSSRDQSGVDAWTNLVRFTEWTRPDLVVHSGDVVEDDPDSDEDHEFGAFQLRRLTTPWRVIPGNHDIGDSDPDPYHGLVSEERLSRYRRHFGDDRWAVVTDGWLLVGLNSQLFDNVLESEEHEQWDWFEQRIAAHPELPIALFIHKPPAIVSLSDQLFVNKAIGLGARARLLRLAQSGRLRLIGCGHLHEFMTFQSHGVLVVAAPSLSKGPLEGVKRQLGLRCNGAVEYQFAPNSVSFRLLEAEELQPPLLAHRRGPAERVEV
ncbi:metallophosphoesterase family protein [Microbacterium forte]|uniref:metallophosphoesterase family protein n=1 Tax=Microbacterium forte TaxID=2982533 RepID=UPI00289321B9|nr:metallophosphoesterase [Microbacterium sp. A(2022)]